ncbi:Glu/Leu/Phe/Val dehydrogenase dimerization domain-containing protein [Patulibacter sp. NPDC049589]|uniref:Glu/Leu/Phe/Val dehydrogenase dimerization domain-containing protein n=1 Tax=Patulibacter sp. NPDC049589 TaxID=3154731 RepID=UPI0034232669
MTSSDPRQADDRTTGRTLPGSPSAAGDDLFAGERLVLVHDAASGLRAAIALDDTTLGPALGGVRLKRYPDAAAGIREAQRLAAAMTLKNAAAGLPYGGGKAVILDDGPVPDRAALMAAFGRAVAGLGGAYLPGVDMGTTTADLATMGRAGATVSCADEDPSPWTALGVHAAVLAAVRHTDGRDGLAGVRVLVQGAGHVGATLARLVRDSGGTVLVADVDPVRASAVAADVGGSVVAADDVLTTECDVFAPCAVARVLDERTIPRLRCRIVAGAANDTLAERADADRLAGRGVLYVPDFLANAGGVIHIHALRAGWDAGRLRAAVLAVGDRVGAVLADASAAGGTPLDAAEALAADRIARARRDASGPTAAPATDRLVAGLAA